MLHSIGNRKVKYFTRSKQVHILGNPASKLKNALLFLLAGVFLFLFFTKNGNIEFNIVIIGLLALLCLPPIGLALVYFIQSRKKLQIVIDGVKKEIRKNGSHRIPFSKIKGFGISSLEAYSEDGDNESFHLNLQLTNRAEITFVVSEDKREILELGQKINAITGIHFDPHSYSA